MRKSKTEYAQQGQILCCQCCGNTWASFNQFEIEQTRHSPIGGKCPACIYIDMARRHAHQQGISLKKAVARFLKGMAKRERSTEQAVWTDKEKREVAAP